MRSARTHRPQSVAGARSGHSRASDTGGDRSGAGGTGQRVSEQGLRYVSQHPNVKGWEGFSGDSALRSAERIEAQWIRCSLTRCGRAGKVSTLAQHPPSPWTEDAMMFEPRCAKLELFSTGLGYEGPKEQERSLGFAIFVVATEDYGSMDPEIHADARNFLFPPSADWQNQFDWHVPGRRIEPRLAAGCTESLPVFVGLAAGGSIGKNIAAPEFTKEEESKWGSGKCGAKRDRSCCAG